MKITTIVTLLCVLITASGFGQSSKSSKSKKPVLLFQVNKNPVYADEFVYLYRKNHQAKPEEFTKEKVNEYLSLYINFKLKVEEARRRGMDTTSTFVSEFESYRNELRKPYLPDARLTDSLVRLTYERLKEEVKASHILINVKEDATPEDTLQAYKRIMEIKKRAENGEDFASLAAAYSEDPSAKTNQGSLGYFTALQMVYPFETAAYQTPVGAISDPVRTRYGYHLVKVEDKKPARGEVEVSHIMLKTGSGIDEKKVKEAIFDIYSQLNAGASWDELVQQHSEDSGTKNSGGKLRPFGVGTMAAFPEFEQAAFSLQKPGDISDPVKSPYGWHILKLERKVPLPPLEELSSSLKSKVTRDERLQISKQAWQKKFREQYQFSENKDTKDKVFALADSSLMKAKWNPTVPSSLANLPLFTLKGRAFNAQAFVDFAIEKQKTQSVEPSRLIEHLYENFVDSKMMEMLEEEIVAENPDFKFLVKEYYEGILLFEIMEDEVWNKAVEDSTGLERHFENNRGRYAAGDRVKAVLYSSASQEAITPLTRLIEGKDTVAIDEYVNKNNIKTDEGSFEKGDRTILSRIPWEPGVYSIENSGMYYIAWIQRILPPGPKTFEEARAEVISDYQQALEQEWLTLLRKKYPVKINEKGKRYVFETLKL